MGCKKLKLSYTNPRWPEWKYWACSVITNGLHSCRLFFSASTPPSWSGPCDCRASFSRLGRCLFLQHCWRCLCHCGRAHWFNYCPTSKLFPCTHTKQNPDTKFRDWESKCKDTWICPQESVSTIPKPEQKTAHLWETPSRASSVAPYNISLNSRIERTLLKPRVGSVQHRFRTGILLDQLSSVKKIRNTVLHLTSRRCYN